MKHSQYEVIGRLISRKTGATPVEMVKATLSTCVRHASAEVGPMTAFFAQMDQPQTFTDDDREQAIVRAGNAMKAAFARYEGSSNFADLGDAHRARMSMESLINGRSAAQVARMEQSRGLACA